MQTVLDEYLRPAELAAELKVCEMTLKRWKALGTGPSPTKIGQRVYYSRSAVAAWLKSREQSASRKRAVA
jgi:predicted DNA-binding transcriptional regulator AlpA